jgi:hypothetical protein
MYDLVKRLRECAFGECFNCQQYKPTTNASVCSKELMKQTADAIEELICEVAAEHNARLDAEERQRWIPVTERLPEYNKQVLIYAGFFQPYTEVAYYCGEWRFAYDDTEVPVVYYWMPLPEPPKGE